MSDNTNDERTPLIRRTETPTREDERFKEFRLPNKVARAYSVLFGCLLVFALLIHIVPRILPIPLSDTEANRHGEFPGLHAYNEYLSHFTAPHSVNSRENGVMKEWLASLAYDFQAEAHANGLQMDVIANDTTKKVLKESWYNEDEQWFIESRNVIVRLHGQNNRSDALLINAHYDSVPTSHGVTDNGIGTSVALELLRYFVHHPPQNTMIFLFNNFEEGGLIGAKQFITHPWWPTVRLFINLEGAGAGGRAVLFRSTSLGALKRLASSKSHYLHATPLGNDMMKSKLLKSDTDYSVFVGDGTPGLDIAFYAPRSHYHTPRDDLAHASTNAVQYMGQMALGAAIAIDEDETGLLSEKHDLEREVYYDILGRILVAYSFKAYIITNILVLIAVPLMSAAYWTLKSNSQRLSVLTRKSLLTLQGLAAVFVAIIFMIVSVAVAAIFMIKVNPLMTYGNVNCALVYLFCAALFGLFSSQLLCVSFSKSLRATLTNLETTLYGVTAFWWVLLVLATYFGSRGIAALYFSIYCMISSALATAVYQFTPANKTWRLPLVFILQIGVPFVCLMEICFMSMDSMRHATVDGTPEFVVYGLLSIPVINILVNLLPWIHHIGELRRMTILTGMVLIVILTVCSALLPFNGGWSPNKAVFNQEYNVSAVDALATVSLISSAGIQSTLKSILPRHELDSLECHVHKVYQTKCTYQTDLIPWYASQEGEMKVEVLSRHCTDSTCRLDGTFTSKNSLLCRIHVDSMTNLTNGWVNGQKTEEDFRSLVVYSTEYGKTVNWSLEYPPNAQGTAQVSCWYDEWTEGELPAFTWLRDNFPDDTVLLLRGQGLALAHFASIDL
ncbi:uncharacterized protein BYT42DRAFT_646560 [Radiomyces spectabilis]|uniref:uncharacterized protein n=1 Tax=Radiomyces spectabilis TaxID=64574 RepID=UPI00221EFDF4|nr:uncharacterized protein BYT42DRAFT_646560 [Radiomyces spectabilis]KAI8374612.1 hypothetical protein BYT42DRAFT_646560 [Radiomyces spectabilis]